MPLWQVASRSVALIGAAIIIAGAALWLLIYVGVGWTLVALIVWVAPTFVAYRIARRKDRDPALGALAGLLLSWLGVLIVALMPYRGKRCQACAEQVRVDAVVCRHCGRDL